MPGERRGLSGCKGDAVVPVDWIGWTARKMPAMVPRLLGLSLGMALLRVWRSWVFLVVTPVENEAFLGLGLRDVFSLGTIAGVLMCLLFLKGRRSLTGSWGLPIGLGCMTLGTAVLLFAGSQGALRATLPMGAVVLGAGMGFALLQAAWIEWLGLCATPLVTLLSYMVAWLLHAAFWIPLRALTVASPVFCILILLMPLLSLGMMVVDAMARPADAQGLTIAQLEPCSLGGVRTSLPILLWTWVFTGAYCIGTAYTGLGSSIVGTMLGELAAVLILVTAFCVLGSHFDYTTTYRFSMITLALGCVAAAFDNQNPVWVQACFSASNVMIMALATTFLCAAASLKHMSAAWGYSVLMLGWYAIALGTRRVIALTGWEPSGQSVLFAMLAVGVLLLLGLAVWRETDLLSQWKDACLADADDRFVARCQEIARQGGLGERETGVLVLLAQGETYAEISEHLFIALGTVRAHTSHIYEKLGIHSRQELVGLIDRDTLGD